MPYKRPIYYVLDEQGQPRPVADALAFGEWMNGADRVVAQNQIGCVFVSTVFLGIDHSYRAVGPPVLWESMIFGGACDGEMQRYTSREAAITGHHAMLARVAVDPSEP